MKRGLFIVLFVIVLLFISGQSGCFVGTGPLAGQISPPPSTCCKLSSSTDINCINDISQQECDNLYATYGNYYTQEIYQSGLTNSCNDIPECSTFNGCKYQDSIYQNSELFCLESSNKLYQCSGGNVDKFGCSESQKGDANDDGVIDGNDLNCIQAYIGTIESQCTNIMCGDVDGNEILSNSDVNCITSYITGGEAGCSFVFKPVNKGWTEYKDCSGAGGCSNDVSCKNPSITNTLCSTGNCVSQCIPDCQYSSECANTGIDISSCKSNNLCNRNTEQNPCSTGHCHNGICNTWIDITPTPVGTVFGNYRIAANLEFYNGFMYTSTYNSIPEAQVIRYNGGTSWTGIGPIGSNIVVNSLKNYNGDLYVGANNGRVYKYDGFSWTELPLFPISVTSITDLIVFNDGSGDKLYALAAEENVFRYDNGVWTNLGKAWTYGGPIYYSLEVYNNNLYAGVYKYNGPNNWVSTNFPTLTPYPTIFDGLEVYNDKLYAGTFVNGFGNAKIYSYDGNSWTSVTTLDPITSRGIVSLQTYNGKLYASTMDSYNIWMYDGSTWTNLGNIGYYHPYFGTNSTNLFVSSGLYVYYL